MRSVPEECDLSDRKLEIQILSFKREDLRFKGSVMIAFFKYFRSTVTQKQD